MGPQTDTACTITVYILIRIMYFGLGLKTNTARRGAVHKPNTRVTPSETQRAGTGCVPEVSLVGGNPASDHTAGVHSTMSSVTFGL